MLFHGPVDLLLADSHRESAVAKEKSHPRHHDNNQYQQPQEFCFHSGTLPKREITFNLQPSKTSNPKYIAHTPALC